MHPALAAFDGPFTVAALPDVPRWAISNALRSGEIFRVLPGVYAPADTLPNPLEAARLYIRGRGVFSHVTALRLWKLHEPDSAEPLHVTTRRGSGLRSAVSVIVHTRHVLLGGREREGMPVTSIENTLVDSWPYLDPARRLGVVFGAVTSRLTTPLRLAATLGTAPHLPQRRLLADLIDRMAAGCQSPLEIFGADRVFTGVPGLRRQVPVRVRGRTYYLDVYAEVARVDIELDGAAWHASPEQRERDIRRDAALATQGILVLRYSYQRLVREPWRVRQEVEEVIASRSSRRPRP